jgi:hypothetical protein
MTQTVDLPRRKDSPMPIRALDRRPLRGAIALTVGLTAGVVLAGGSAGLAGAQLARHEHAQSTQPPPKPLLAIEEQAEDIGDRVPSGKWPRIAADVAKVKASWAAYHSHIAADNIDAATVQSFETALTNLTTAVRAKNGPKTSQAANDLSRATVELFGKYKLSDPVQVGRLDVIGRQIALDIAAKNPEGVAQQIEQARMEWAAIRDDVSGRSTAVAQQVDATIAALAEGQQANRTGFLNSETRVFAELVDSIEQLYG